MELGKLYRLARSGRMRSDEASRLALSIEAPGLSTTSIGPSMPRCCTTLASA
jgi:hypothetical protein